MEFFDVYTIGITGTKGKSTTSSLIYKILQDQKVKSMLLGNIGVPIFDYIENIDKDTILVLEMSSHQLEYMKLSPNIAILLNIYEEHLDHYKSFQDYIDAKCNIFRNQKNEKANYFLYNSDEELLNKLSKTAVATTYRVSLKSKDNNKPKAENDVYIQDNKVYFKQKSIYSIKAPRNLIGDYNLNNIMFALAVSEILKLDINKTINTISEFKTLQHRLELVGEYDGIIYYDNAIATVPIATIEAVEALETIKKVDTLIIGGMDRGIDYTEFISYLNNSKITNIICMPKTGHDIAEKLDKQKKQVYIVETLQQAVSTAKKVTTKGEICLLSPAAASYGYFKNFEEKGNIYQELVRNN